MSHEYMVRCKCGAETEQWNHAEENLIQAVQDCYPLYLLSKTKWDLDDLKFDVFNYSGLARFLAKHWNHGGFEVVGEYSSDMPTHVQPEAPPLVWEQARLDKLRNDMEKLMERAQELEDDLATIRPWEKPYDLP